MPKWIGWRAVALTVAVLGLGACEWVNSQPDAFVKHCRLDKDCAEQEFCVQGLCTRVEIPDLAMGVRDYSFVEGAPIDFSLVSEDAGCRGCPGGTRCCGYYCIPTPWCCRDTDCRVPGQKCQMDGTCQASQGDGAGPAGDGRRGASTRHHTFMT